MLHTCSLGNKAFFCCEGQKFLKLLDLDNGTPSKGLIWSAQSCISICKQCGYQSRWTLSVFEHKCKPEIMLDAVLVLSFSLVTIHKST